LIKKGEKLTTRLFTDSEDAETKTIRQMAAPQECLTFNSVAYLLEMTTNTLLLLLLYFYLMLLKQ
jgi:hypothetical protein